MIVGHIALILSMLKANNGLAFTMTLRKLTALTIIRASANTSLNHNLTLEEERVGNIYTGKDVQLGKLFLIFSPYFKELGTLDDTITTHSPLLFAVS